MGKSLCASAGREGPLPGRQAADQGSARVPGLTNTVGLHAQISLTPLDPDQNRQAIFL